MNFPPGILCPEKRLAAHRLPLWLSSRPSLLTSWRRNTSQASSVLHGKFQCLSFPKSKQPQKINFHSEVKMTLSMRQHWDSSDFLKPFCLYKRNLNLGNHRKTVNSLWNRQMPPCRVKNHCHQLPITYEWCFGHNRWHPTKTEEDKRMKTTSPCVCIMSYRLKFREPGYLIPTHNLSSSKRFNKVCHGRLKYRLLQREIFSTIIMSWQASPNLSPGLWHLYLLSPVPWAKSG